MLDTPEIIQTDVQAAAVIHLTVPRGDMMRVFGAAVGELMATLAAQDVKPEGAIFAHHLKMSDDVFDFELGVPVNETVQSTGRVRPGFLPAAKVARTVYRGAYEGLPAAWGEFSRWMKNNGQTPAEDLWEVYETGPQTTSDPSGWRTQLNRPLRAR